MFTYSFSKDDNFRFSLTSLFTHHNLQFKFFFVMKTVYGDDVDDDDRAYTQLFLKTFLN